MANAAHAGKTFVFVAPDYTEHEVLHRESASPAASAWVRGFLTVFSRIAIIEKSIWFPVHSSWPKGSLYVRPEPLEQNGRERVLVGYCNLPLLKTNLIGRSLFEELLHGAKPETSVVIYGQGVLRTRDIKRLSTIFEEVYLIVPDVDFDHSSQVKMKKSAKYATGGVVYLPDVLRGSFEGLRALCFQGIVQPPRECTTQQTNCRDKLVFVGGVDKFGGARFLRESIELVPNYAQRVVVIGRVKDRVEARLLEELGVLVTGYLDENEMAQNCENAFAFLNPRDPRMEESAYNFPSKLLLYFGYDRPVISTDTLGMPRDLVKTLRCENVRTPGEFSREIVKACESSEAVISSRVSDQRSYIESNLSEQAVVSKLVDFFRIDTGSD